MLFHSLPAFTFPVLNHLPSFTNPHSPVLTHLLSSTLTSLPFLTCFHSLVLTLLYPHSPTQNPCLFTPALISLPHSPDLTSLLSLPCPHSLPSFPCLPAFRSLVLTHLPSLHCHLSCALIPCPQSSMWSYVARKLIRPWAGAGDWYKCLWHTQPLELFWLQLCREVHSSVIQQLV